MFPHKLRIADFNSQNLLAKSATEHHWQREPLQTRRSLDSVALLPRLFLELNRIQQNKPVHLIDEIKVAEPG